jgi:hypothetical protein
MQDIKQRVRNMFDHKFKNNPVFRISPKYRQKIKDFIDETIDMVADEVIRDINK